MNIKELPQFKRPREKLKNHGAKSLSDVELVALIIRSGTAGKNALGIASALLPRAHVSDLITQNYSDVSKIGGIGPAGAASVCALIELCRRSQNTVTRAMILSTQDAIVQFYDIHALHKEHFVALYLNARYELIVKDTISVGTLDASLVHPRDVFAPALEHHAAYIIVGHNHPSGSCEPSQADIDMTRRLVDAGELLHIPVLDHIIVSESTALSMKECGQV